MNGWLIVNVDSVAEGPVSVQYLSINQEMMISDYLLQEVVEVIFKCLFSSQ